MSWHPGGARGVTFCARTLWSPACPRPDDKNYKQRAVANSASLRL
ncbi:MAG: hypothetical protein RLZZ555_1275 [Pseudomonadota bacterium]|jgi:hypothetical protein